MEQVLLHENSHFDTSIGRIDLLSNPVLEDKIKNYKWDLNKGSTEDLGMLLATIVYLIHNPENIPELEDRRDEKRISKCHPERFKDLQTKILQIELEQHAWNNHISDHSDSERSYLQNHASDLFFWFKVCYCCAVCQDAVYCDIAQKDYHEARLKLSC